jgi:hypothetical protein
MENLKEFFEICENNIYNKINKKCHKCEIEKEIKEYHKNKNAKDGYRNICKNCTKKIRNDHYVKNKDYYKKYNCDYYYNNKGSAVIKS